MTISMLLSRILGIMCSVYILQNNKIQEIDCKDKRFKSVSSKNETVVNAIQQVQLDFFRSNDYSKLFLNINTKSFVLKADDNQKLN
jgi:translation elongation factor EF-1alpha